MHPHRTLCKAMKACVTIALCSLATCATTPIDNTREEKILEHVTGEKQKMYDNLLVPLGQYTTMGGEFQKKYYKHLIGVAGEITEKKTLKIIPGSIGFYYDKKSGDKNKLYFGLDIHSEKKYVPSLTTNSLKLLRKDVGIVIRTLHSCKSIFLEKEIVGMVMGWKWYRDYGDDFISIWIDKDDVSRYEKQELTLDEVLERSTITNSEGKVIRLQ